jgi:hypothetical protein
MKRLYFSALILLMAMCLNSCTFFYNLSNYRSTTEAFTNALVNKKYDKCISLLDFEKGQQPNMDQMHAQLDTFSNVITRNFGNKLEYSFLKAEKHLFSSKGDDGLPPGMTLVEVEFHNDENVGIMQVVFDDKTSKIYNIKALDIKERVPDMFKFWLFGIFPLIVLAINIYTIIRVKRSNLKLKWLFYIGIVILNFPSIEYNAINGLFFKPLYFQMLLGLGLEKSGYFGSIWSVGIPVGAIIAIWRLNTREKVITAESIAAQYGGEYPSETLRPTAPETPGDAE